MVLIMAENIPHKSKSISNGVYVFQMVFTYLNWLLNPQVLKFPRTAHPSINHPRMGPK